MQIILPELAWVCHRVDGIHSRSQIWTSFLTVNSRATFSAFKVSMAMFCCILLKRSWSNLWCTDIFLLGGVAMSNLLGIRKEGLVLTLVSRIWNA